MIATVHRQIRDWIVSLVGDITVSLNAPQRDNQGAGVSLYLMEVDCPVVTRKERSRWLQITLRYLVTSWSDSVEEAHERLEKLMLGATELADVQLEAGCPPLALWTALGTAPRPAFVLRYALHQEQRERPSPLVKAPPLVVSAPLSQLAGVVLGPAETPVANARVQVPGERTGVRTDAAGRFRLPALPRDRTPEKLLVEARGQSQALAVNPGQGEQTGQVVLRWAPTEED